MSDEVDQAQVVEERERQAALAVVLRAASAEEGDGFCSGCGDAIDPDRLKAQPRAKRCVECQTARERFLKLFPVKA